MSPNPERFLAHLQAEGYHSRSNKHSNALAEAIVSDLVQYCPKIAEHAAAGTLVYNLNFKLTVGTAVWNVDLVLGSPGLGATAAATDGRICRQTPATVQIAIELKSVMTEHRKAVKNRKRDLEAHHEHVHNYDNLAIAGGVLVINGASSFRSPLRPELTQHKNVDRLVEHCLIELRAVAVRGGPRGYGLDAACAVVVNMDNVNFGSASYVAKPPVGDPLHYDAFIRSICEQYSRRF
jgi:hypothetical protein